MSSMIISGGRSKNQAVIRQIDGHLHAGQPVTETGDNLIDQRANAYGYGVDGDFACIEAGGGEQARCQVVQQACLFVDEGHQFGLRQGRDGPSR